MVNFEAFCGSFSLSTNLLFLKSGGDIIVDNHWRKLTSFFSEKDNLEDSDLCKICMDNPVDCVMLECGHMCTCTTCGKQMAECPICRQYVVRVVRTFKA